MCKYRLQAVGSFVAMLFLFVTGCGKQTVLSAPPAVTATSPANGTIGVSSAQVVTATFSVAMNPATLTTSSFTLTGPAGTNVNGLVAYSASGSIASFTPAVSLAYNTLYTAAISTTAADTLGDQLASNYSWSFTTAAQPTVVATNPINGATNVPVSQVLTAAFSKTMNPTTLNAATFTLSGAGSGLVSGSITYSAAGSIAAFTPAAPLAYNTAYTATITTGASDISGAQLAANFVWTFTTAARPTIVSTIPTNGATGIAVNQALTAIFSKTMNCASLASPALTFTLAGPATTPVAGTVTCFGTSATFTPNTALTTNTVYTATVTNAAQDTTGNPIAANYSWTFRTVPAPTPPTVTATTPTNGATAVPVNQAISAAFSTAMSPATLSSTSFTVQAGGVAVAGVVAYVPAGSVATFTPAAALAANTVYTATITTGAQNLTGTALASNYVWTFTTATAPNTTRPTVLATVPLNAATAVPTAQIISATFSSPMNPASIDSATFLLTGPGATTVVGQVAYSSIGNTATYTPTSPLAPNTLFTATITTGATDLSGNTIATNYVWTFTTGATANSTAPQLVSTSPANSATGVPINQTISGTFSAAMNPLTLSTATFQLTGPGSTVVSGTVSYDAINFVASFTPSSNLAPNSIYVATITSGATDLSGNSLGNTGAPNPWSFTTGTTVLAPPVNLGTAAAFGSFGGAAGITNQGIFTVVNNGNIGTTGVSTLVTGFHDNGPGCIYTETPLNKGLVNGSIYTAPPPPTVACPTEGTAVTAAIAAQAALDALTAYNALVAFPNGLDVSTCPGCGGGSAGELGNRTLAPGVYKSAPGSYAISQGDLTLDAKGDPNAFWVFQMATTLTVGTPTAHQNVLLVNGAQAKNVFWQVGTAATVNGILGGGTMQGTIIAQAGISVSTAGVVAITTINGRLLVLTGPVTLVNTVVNVP